jgi:serine/threonine protein kinase
LHKTVIGYHGNLSSSTCIVDNRWVVKLTDFGLKKLFNTLRLQGAISYEEQKDYQSMTAARAEFKSSMRLDSDLFHVAPELLRLPPNASDGTQEADIYSFAMIMYQVCLQQELFVDTNMPAEGGHGLKDGVRSDN